MVLIPKERIAALNTLVITVAFMSAKYTNGTGWAVNCRTWEREVAGCDNLKPLNRVATAREANYIFRAEYIAKWQY